MTLPKKNVIIIGAGISGLAAAQELAKDPSIQVSMLEARNRLGGRLDTRRNLVSPRHPGGDHVATPGQSCDIPLDFGASWIHGVDSTNPIVPLAEAAHARLVPTNQDVIYKHPGKPALDEDKSNHYWAVLFDIFAIAQEFSRQNRSRISVHTSFKAWFDQFLATRQSQDEHLPDYMSEDDLRVIPRLALFWAGENAIELEKVSLKYMDAEKMFPGDHSIVATGYDGILNVIVKDLVNVPIHLEHIVNRIEYSDVGVTVSTNKGTFTADVVLVTLPLGVLKSDSVVFSPPLPAKKQMAIQRLGFGTMVKVIMSFPTCFWPKDRHFINFLPSQRHKHPIPELTHHLNKNQLNALTIYMDDLCNYTSMMPIHDAPILIGYAANASAAAFEKLTDQEAMEVLFCHLSHYYDELAKDPDTYRPTQYFMTRWGADPFAGGSYTSIPVGSYQSDLAEFEIPVGAHPVAIEKATSNDLCDIVDSLSIVTPSQSKRKLALTHGLREQVGSRNGYERKMIELADGPRAFSNNNHALIIPGALLPEQRDAQGRSQGYLVRRQPHQGFVSQLGLPTVIIKGLQGLVGLSSNSAVELERKPVKKDLLVSINGKNIHGPHAYHSYYRDGYIHVSNLGANSVRPLHLEANKRNYRRLLDAKANNQDDDYVRMEMVAEDNVATGRVFFAGEHTTPTNFASVHGALMTGRREAAKIAQNFRA
ncbi:hypothetical protein BG006_011496 [Podila minutissima]|uniref:Amine oxidase domain-containing protein n=1 Tax=Podila minutissima TaxID=64525 RepID=A0A9P5SBV3_9FUNG|nr:hypothetical protein BG006_011496 [Podila minutissima]